MPKISFCESDGHNYGELLQEQMLSSDDPDRQVAALLFNVDGKLVVSEANSFISPTHPSKRKIRSSREFGQKYFWLEHAERKAIFKALKAGIELEGATIVVSLFPCADCARAIIQSGIKTVMAPDISGKEVQHLQSMIAAKEILLDANINLLQLPQSTHPSSTPK